MRSPDEQLLAELHAPPDLSDGVESLEYWRARSKRLSWYRIRARREAQLMTQRWERRGGGAVPSPRGGAGGARRPGGRGFLGGGGWRAWRPRGGLGGGGGAG